MGKLTKPGVVRSSVHVFYNQGADAAQGAGTTYYGIGHRNTTESLVQFVAPFALQARSLRGRFNQGATGTTQLILRVNEADSALDTGAIAGTGAEADISDTANSVDVAAGERVSLKSVAVTASTNLRNVAIEVRRVA